jgi:tRNA 2-thiouridine synthesizing protein A
MAGSPTMTRADIRTLAARPAAATLDAIGLKCPLPALKTRRALARLKAGASLIVTADDPMAAIDIPHLVRELGDELLTAGEDRGALRFVIRKRCR